MQRKHRSNAVGGSELANETTLEPLRLARQGYFFVGGCYVESNGGQVRTGQMHVEYQIPENQTQPWPVVMLAGNTQSGLNYTGTPDGRAGWAQFFLRRGYAVYVVDPPSRARSAHNADKETLRVVPSKMMERYFTAPKLAGLWPQAALHTQWPGTGVAGDPIFDQFMDQVYPSIVQTPLQEQLSRDAGAALLDRIGPAILLTHSQAGAYGWLMADARPGHVKAIIAIEPSGPPVYERAQASAATARGPSPAPIHAGWNEDGALTKPFGLTASTLTYDPPLADDEALTFAKQETGSQADSGGGWLQAEPARQLAHLREVPVLVVTGEASYHGLYDHCTVSYLKQAGVNTTHIRLADDCSIHGNGHMMMLELNNHEIAAVAEGWLQNALDQ
ncbi:alpha/beta hydrolase [Burkholderia sp. S171]|uniref:alpha/beta hydrolase n=1 Tax=Burkholderia sp. S171 TaxID=1641860 RepID=UPI00131DCB86|nr:alpha/beta hydrolase [Burkholderia sp. S171]